MREGRLLLFIFVLIIGINLVSSAHYVVGYVEDAKDGESANNHIVTLWNPLNGPLDNLTDIIGVNGNSNYDHVYMFDCELLLSSCSIGDVLSLRIVDSGDNYVSRIVNMTVTVSGYDMVKNLTVNSPPSIIHVSPGVDYLTNDVNVDFVCNYSDLDSDSGYVSLISNFSGVWNVIDTKPSLGGNVIFSEVLVEGEYGYFCVANDSLVYSFNSNRSIFVDLTDPSIFDFTVNESSFCGGTSARFECLSNDYYGLSNVVLSSSFAGDVFNYSMSYSGGVYFYELFISDVGDWNFTCYSYDNAGNFEMSSVLNAEVSSGFPELYVSSGDLFFDNLNPAENELVNITVNVSNVGCVSSGDFLTSFYVGNRSNGGVFVGDKTFSLNGFSSGFVSVLWNALIGNNNIFVYVDSNDSLFEGNESDNYVNESLNVFSWQEFYGNVSALKLLFFEENFTTWGNVSDLSGNIFVADSESIIDWGNLVAIGRNDLGSESFNDFFEIDSVLGMSSFVDSVNFSFFNYSEESVLIHGMNITNVPFIQSTDNNNFKTGIMWDSSDSIDSEFDSVDGEDLVFVSSINKNSVGKYGIYDYEIRIPVKLREEDGTDVSEVYFYYELL